ncbi:hypothetical protein C0991_003479, partial [Blastosporella zonata]
KRKIHEDQKKVGVEASRSRPAPRNKTEIEKAKRVDKNQEKMKEYMKEEEEEESGSDDEANPRMEQEKLTPAPRLPHLHRNRNLMEFM